MKGVNLLMMDRLDGFNLPKLVLAPQGANVLLVKEGGRYLF